ncbi:ImmA/IrrE family metallo-endopeptidase [Actinokineospora globicatena]|uniref:ImmA/IrrE family metallo-endopeptidase n=1 Tax=Actinokineospora globicatena TaxID=103729 RepID=UPI0020A2DB8A|nr:ImmA/IrrE family metallo-endopeptidase [Actinokineospora globicatena]MCP2303399.1 protein of unknown function (DUF955) [Actinokineospora globicatena]GLW79467.1 hypothetical protein Aglo01_39490 [Actinokineospora globicatena]GLW86123.1 hypothetical protein Aglo02_37620 [Actinokineospora globicatena]
MGIPVPDWLRLRRLGPVPLKRLRRDCARLLADFDIPADGDIHHFCAQVGARLGRDIDLIPMALRSTDPTGVWLSTRGGDYIVYESETSTPHQEHIIAHELGHLLCGHIGDNLDGTALELLFPDIDPTALLARQSYTATEEREAEVMAGVILAHLTRGRRSRPTQNNPSHADIARVHRSLGRTDPTAD